MEGLYVDSIPRVLLARILVQLYILPQKLVSDARFNLIAILLAGLQRFGTTSDLNGFFEFCLQQARVTTDNVDHWWWKDLTTFQTSDWHRLDLRYFRDQSEPISLHIQIMTEEARKGAVHIKYGHEVAMARDERFFYPYQGSTVRIDSILNATMGYLNGVPQHDGSEGSSSSSSMQTLGQLVQSRLDRFKHDYEAVSKQQEYTLQASSDYILMGALMHRSNYDQRQPEWELYLRDYISSENGKLWRILSELNADRNETKITSDQALADIHGEATVDEDGKTVQPSAHPREFRPVYLFYCNRTMVAETFHSTIEGSASSNTAPTSVAGQTTSNTKACNAAAASAAAAEEESGITLADYILDEDDQHYMYENPDDDKVCKVCGIDEIIEDVNNMFYCDHCNLGVHQLCEDPTIAQFETELDPWYCRECSRQKGLPMPQPKDQQALLVLPAKRSNDGQHSTMEEAKRKREERG